MKKLFPLKTSISLLFVFFLVFQAFSQNNVDDLIGARANSVDNFMNNKGYVHITSSKSYGGIYSYWWKSTKNKCVSIRIEDGHVTDTKTAPSSDCQQYANADRYNSNNNSYQSHQSHHHDSYNHYNNADHDNSFERGYNDGVHNKSYHNPYSNDQVTEAYAKGYEAGVQQRSSNTNYHAGGGGYSNTTSSAKLGDVKGWSAQRAYKEIENRGYRFIKEYRNNGKLVKVWYSTEYRKCKKTAEKDGYIDLVEESKQCGK